MLLIEELLTKYGIKQAHIARVVGYDPASISKWCNGISKPYPRQAARVAAAIGWKLDPYLLFTDAEEVHEKLGNADDFDIRCNVVSQQSISFDVKKLQSEITALKYQTEKIISALDGLIKDVQLVNDEVTPC